MKRVFLHGTFAGNRGDVLMRRAATSALVARGLTIVDTEEEADAVMSCCGYWCGDPWGELWSRKMRERVLQWKQDGRTVILLPQTFGPFTDERIGAELQTMVDACDLVCPRDAVSYQYVTDLCGQRDYIQQFPDYTIEVEPVTSEIFQPHAQSVAVIPNLRMMDKTDTRISAAYLPFLGSAIAVLRDAGTDPFLLIHEDKDLFFADALRQQYGDLPVVTEPDAQKTKWIIGQSKAVISSRYHGILNALYQDIPVLATGWCHKFPALMEEWGRADALIDLALTTDEDTRLRITDALQAGRSNVSMQTLYREKTRNLWENVRQALI